jgi:predicted PurR-regulated permease PerM
MPMAQPPEERPPEMDETRPGLIRISFPAQLVILAVLLFVAWSVAGLIGEALFVIVAALLLALVLNPLVKQVQRLHLPRIVATLLVVVGFLALLAGGIVLLALPLISQIADLQERLPAMVDGAEDRLDDLQGFLNRLDVGIDADALTDELVAGVTAAVPAPTALIGYGLSIAQAATLALIILVTSIYMLADSARIHGFIVNHFPTGSRQDGEEYSSIAQSAVVKYVKGQLLVSLSVGFLTGGVLYTLGLVGIFPLGAQYALLFGVLAGVLEIIPFIGPVLAAIPPIAVALIDDPLSAIWVLLAFIAIQQIEGNLLSPMLMGGALRVHPIIVIFATLVGLELRGLVGVIIAVPLIPLLRETLNYLRRKVELDGSWLVRRELQPEGPGDRPGARRAGGEDPDHE